MAETLMTDTLLTLLMPNEVAQDVEDLLRLHPDKAHGFTSAQVAGHGNAVALLSAGDQVSGHAPRTCLQMIGAETDMRALLDIVRAALPQARIYFWLQPVIEAGYL